MPDKQKGTIEELERIYREQGEEAARKYADVHPGLINLAAPSPAAGIGFTPPGLGRLYETPAAPIEAGEPQGPQPQFPYISPLEALGKLLAGVAGAVEAPVARTLGMEPIFGPTTPQTPIASPTPPPAKAPAKAPTKVPASGGWGAGWNERQGPIKGYQPWFEEIPAAEPTAPGGMSKNEMEVLRRVQEDPVGVMTNLEFQMGKQGLDPEIRKTYRAHLAYDLHRLGILDVGTAMSYVEQGPVAGVGGMVSEVQQGRARLEAQVGAQGREPIMTPNQFEQIRSGAFARATKMKKKLVVIRDFQGKDHPYDAKSGGIAKYEKGKVNEEDIERVDLPSIMFYGNQGALGAMGAQPTLIPDAAAIAGNLNLGL